MTTSRRQFLKLSSSVSLTLPMITPFNILAASKEKFLKPLNIEVQRLQGFASPKEEKSIAIVKLTGQKAIKFEISISPSYLSINPINKKHFLITDLRTQRVQLIDGLNGQILKTFFPTEGNKITGRARYSQNGEYIVISEANALNSQGELRIIDKLRYRTIHTFSTGGLNPFETVLSKDGIAVISNTGTQTIADLPSLSLINKQGDIIKSFFLDKNIVNHNHAKPEYAQEKFYLWKKNNKGDILAASHCRVMAFNITNGTFSKNKIRKIELNPNLDSQLFTPLYKVKDKKLFIHDQNRLVIVDINNLKITYEQYKKHRTRLIINDTSA